MRWPSLRRIFVLAAGVTDVAALVAAMLPLSGTECGTPAISASAAGAGSASAAVGQVCHHTSLVAAFTSPAAAAVVLLALTALGLLPLLTLGGRRGWPSAIAALLLAAFFVASFGVSLFWLPTTLLALAASLTPRERPRPAE